MSKTVQYVLFYSVFQCVFLGVHLYVYLRLKTLLAFLQPKVFLIVFIVLALSFPVCTLLEKFVANSFTMMLYAVCSVWLGILLLLLCALVVYEPVRLLLPAALHKTGIVMVSVVLLAACYALINAMFITVTPVSVPLAHLHKTLRVVHLSDIHVGTIHNTGYLTRIVDKVNALNPDMVLITGDFFDGIGKITRKTVEPLNRLRAKTFFTMGNHEIYFDADNVSKLLEYTNVVVLRNEVTEYRGLQIVGIDSPRRDDRKDNPVLEQLYMAGNRPTVLMYHPPVGLEDAQKAGIHLQLSGHTHNGQLFPFNLPTKLFYPHMYGLHRIGDMYLYVTSGAGTWGPPMRLGSRNEIALLHLVPEQSVQKSTNR